MKQYILIIKEGGEPDKATPTEMEGHVQKYMDWAQKLRDRGLYITADGLSQEIRILKTGKQTEIQNGPYAETKEIIGGYYVYTAESYEHAEQLAKECPALLFGSTIELREQMNYE